ncbi:unnamed protein product [Effrenium voratum]|nr:unnamed protein product [Effrenium voratum]
MGAAWMPEALVACNRWISACGDWEKAVALLADLPRRSLEPDKVSYTAAPRRESGGSGGFGKVLDGSVQEALAACGRLRAWRAAAVLATQSFQRDAVAQGAAVAAAGAGGWQRAVAQLAMPGVESDVVARNAALAAAGSAAAWRRALAAATAAAESDVAASAATGNAAVAALAGAAEWRRALRLCRRTVLARSALCSACEKADRWQTALEILCDMPAQDLRPNLVSFGAAISACEKKAEWRCALRLLATSGSGGEISVALAAAVSACENAAVIVSRTSQVQGDHLYGPRSGAQLWPSPPRPRLLPRCSTPPWAPARARAGGWRPWRWHEAAGPLTPSPRASWRWLRGPGRCRCCGAPSAPAWAT